MSSTRLLTDFLQHRPNGGKRTFDEMQASSSNNQPFQPSTDEASSSGSAPRNPFGFTGPSLSLPPIREMRFPGDGFDFRRPVSSISPHAVHSQPVIDLTEDTEASRATAPGSHFATAADTQASRQPRFDHEIIDLSGEVHQRPRRYYRPEHIDLTDETPQANRSSTRSSATQTIQIPDSPDVEFITARNVPQDRNRPDLPLLLSHPFHEIISHEGRQTGAPHHHLLWQAHRRWDEEVQRFHRNRESAGHQTRRDFQAPRLDFDAVGFHLGLPDEDDDETLSQALAHSIADDVQPRMRGGSAIRIAPPPSPRAGFTRNLNEDDELVCPNCGDELGAGKEASVKRQVWIAKACGHVYCGECTQSRNKVKRDKRKGKEPIRGILNKALSTCVVPGCGRKLKGAKQMIQMFL